MNIRMHYIFTGLLLLVFLSSCKKDEDTVAPVISVSSPVASQSFSVLSDIPVSATVSDDVNVKEVNVQLLDVNNNYAMDNVQVPAGTSTVTVNLNYFLSNIHLESGTYHLQLSASDGINTSRSTIPVYIVAIPKKLEKILVFTAAVSTQTLLAEMDTNYSSLSTVHTFSGDHLGGSVSSYYQQVFHLGKYSGPFTSLAVGSYSPVFNVPFAITPDPYFTGFLPEDKKVYVAYRNGMVTGYNPSGTVNYNAASNAGMYTAHFIFNGNKLVAEQKEQSGGSANELVSYYTSGIAYQQTALSMDVVQLCNMDDTHVFLFGNSGGQARIQLFDRTANSIWDPYPYTLPIGLITAAVQLDSNTYLLAHANGTIYKYDYLSASLTTFISGYTAKQLLLEPLKGQLIVVEDHRISSFNLPVPVVDKTLAIPADSVLQIGLLYNR